MRLGADRSNKKRATAAFGVATLREMAQVRPRGFNEMPDVEIPVAPDIRNYLFIDGNYLRRAYLDTMRKLFSSVHFSNIELMEIKKSVDASKAFYYDAIDEDADDAQLRKAYLDEIRGLDGFHVRQGDVTGKKEKKRQKRVDVQLAVECLMHAYNKTIWHASLLAGDLDFEPLVTHLVNVGVHVHVYYEQRSGARGLRDAADVAVPIKVSQFWRWSALEFRAANPLPKKQNGFETPPYVVIKNGRLKSLSIALMEDTRTGTFAVEARNNDRFVFGYADKNRDHLLTFVELEHGRPEWQR
jgi:uncharacterized LabA/DUF88 family protein